MDKLKEIFRKNMMTLTPSYYSGRGATLSDVNSKILAGIWKGIKKEFGKEAAKNFVKMVKGIQVFSATTFINETISLYHNKWIYTEKEKDASGVDVLKNEDGSYNEANMMGTIGSAMFSSGRDDTMAIKSGFLFRRGEKMDKEYISEDGVINYYW